MAQIIFNIPDNKLQDFIDAWGYGYQAVDPEGVPNPLTKGQYAKKLFKESAIDRVKDHKRRQAQLSATWDSTGIEIT